MVTDAFNHAPGQLMMNTGAMIFGRPSFGAWTVYGLGSESQDLPAFVVFSTGSKGPSGGNSCWGSGFLPTVYQGVQFRNVGDPVLYLSNPRGVDETLQRDSLDTINKLNKMRLDVTGDPEIATRINSFEMAFKMQKVAPEVMDISKEPKHILEMYGAEPGKPSFANTVLDGAAAGRTRRALCADLSTKPGISTAAWCSDLTKNCKDTDQACAALVQGFEAARDAG